MGGFFGSFFKRNGGEADPGVAAQQPLRGDRPHPAPAGSGGTAGHEEIVTPIEGQEENDAIEILSPLDNLMQDPVVAALMGEGVVDMSQALVAQRRHQQEPGSTLWRTLAQLPQVDKDLVFATAARVQGFAAAQISDAKPGSELIEAVLGLFPEKVGKEMFRLDLLPFGLDMDASKRHRLTLATYDPARQEVQAFIRRFPITVELVYAPFAAVTARISSIVSSEAAPAPLARPAPAQMETSKGVVAEKEAATQQREAVEASAHAETHHNEEAPGTFSKYSVINPKTATPEELARGYQLDTRASDEVMVQDGIEPARTDHISGDGHFSADAPEPTLGSDDADGPPVTPEASLPFLAEPDVQPEPKPYALQVPDNGAPPTDGGEEELEDAPDEAPNLEAIKSKDRVVAMLLRKEIVTSKQVQEAEQLQKTQKSKETLWRLLTQVTGVDREAIFAEAARVYAFPMARLGEGKPDPEFARSVIDTFSDEKRAELFKLRVLPFECDLEHQTGAIKLVFVTHDPTRPEVHRLMQQLRLERFELRYAPEPVVISALHEAYPRRNEFLDRMNEGAMAFDLGTSYDDKAGLIDESALEDEINRSSLINLFEATLVEAVRQGASDVHIYPNADKKIEIHFRIDGRLNHWHTEDKVHPEALLAVIKDNATNVDRFERDAAQDGFIQRWIDDALIRFRVSVLPIANASAEIRSESIVIRVLDDRKVMTDLRKLGLLGNAMERFDSAIRQPHGMVILTGPTGSGKSTTLVAALHQVVTPEVNVLTVEDPVEYIIPGVRQIKLNHKLGLEEALRSILRHDPDVVMVGEMRDKQTAELAIKLANTGHLTFSTLHTNDAPSAISRLYKMGIEPFLIAYAINLVVAQRLIRTLCPTCKELEDDPDPVMLNKLGFTDEELASTTIYKPGSDTNCKTCKGTGYKGRRAVTEALYFSRAIRHIIVESTKMIDEDVIREQAQKEGMLTLSDSAREIVKMGDTSIMEMVRVVTTES